MQQQIRGQSQIHQYIRDLQSPTDNKFKAKVVYTLTCINNLIANDNLTNLYHLQQLSCNVDTLVQIAYIHPTDPQLIYYVIYLLVSVRNSNKNDTRETQDKINRVINELLDNNILSSQHSNILSSQCNQYTDKLIHIACAHLITQPRLTYSDHQIAQKIFHMSIRINKSSANLYKSKILSYIKDLLIEQGCRFGRQLNISQCAQIYQIYLNASMYKEQLLQLLWITIKDKENTKNDEYIYRKLSNSLSKYLQHCNIGILDQKCLHQVLAICLHLQEVTGVCTDIIDRLMNGYYNQIDKGQYYSSSIEGGRHYGLQLISRIYMIVNTKPDCHKYDDLCTQYLSKPQKSSLNQLISHLLTTQQQPSSPIINKITKYPINLLIPNKFIISPTINYKYLLQTFKLRMKYSQHPYTCIHFPTHYHRYAYLGADIFHVMYRMDIVNSYYNTAMIVGNKNRDQILEFKMIVQRMYLMNRNNDIVKDIGGKDCHGYLQYPYKSIFATSVYLANGQQDNSVVQYLLQKMNKFDKKSNNIQYLALLPHYTSLNRTNPLTKKVLQTLKNKLSVFYIDTQHITLYQKLFVGKWLITQIQHYRHQNHSYQTDTVTQQQQILVQIVDIFIHYLIRNLDSLHILKQLEMYLREFIDQNTIEQQNCRKRTYKYITEWITYNYEEELQRILQQILSMVPYATPLQQNDGLYMKGLYARKIIFALQHYDGVFSTWSPVYRWAINPLDQLSIPACITHLRHARENTLDSLQGFQTLIENCSTSIPIQATQKFINVIIRHWGQYSHHHMFAVQRIFDYLIHQDISHDDLAILKQICINGLHSYQHHTADRQLHDITHTSLTLILMSALRGQQTIFELEQKLQQKIHECIQNSINRILAGNLSDQCSYVLVYSLQLLIWRYQYSDGMVPKTTSDTILNFLTQIFSHIQFMHRDEGIFQQIILLTMQSMVTLSHQSNLLSLPLCTIINRFLLSSHQILNKCNQVLIHIFDIKPKAIAKYRLQTVIPQILLALLSSYSGTDHLRYLDNQEKYMGQEEKQKEREHYIVAYVDMLNNLLLEPDSPYRYLLENNIMLSQFILELLRIEFTHLRTANSGVVVKFAFDALEEVRGGGVVNQIPQNLRYFLMAKYPNNQKMRKVLMGGKFKNSDGVIGEYVPWRTLIKIFNVDADKYGKNGSQKQSVKKQEENTIKQQKKVSPTLTTHTNTPTLTNHTPTPNLTIHTHTPPTLPQKIQYEQEEIKQEKVNNPINLIDIKSPSNKQISPSHEKETIIKSPSNKKQLIIDTTLPDSTNTNINPTPTTLKTQQFITAIFSANVKMNKANTQSPMKKKKKTQNNIQQQQQHQKLNNLKGYLMFIGSLTMLSPLSQSEQQQLKESLTYIQQTISSHAYYCQKAANLGLVNKCLFLHNDVLKIHNTDILDLFIALACTKQKNLIVFNDERAINFFKNILKDIINAKNKNYVTEEHTQNARKVIGIVGYCWSAASEYFTYGLISMLIQMIKIDLCSDEILQLFIKHELTYQIVNQIYQRGLLNKLMLILQQEVPNDEQIYKTGKELSIWVRLAGKICVNQSVRNKLFSIKVHEMSFRKMNIFIKSDFLKDLAFLYASMVYDMESMANWCIQNKIPSVFKAKIQQILNKNQNQQSKQGYLERQFFKFFRYFAKNGQQQIQHLFRINFHILMLDIVKQKHQRILDNSIKDFYKCLSKLYTHKSYSFFLKQQTFKYLLNNYEINNNKSQFIYESCYELSAKIQDRKEIEELKKQGLIETTKCFNSKVNSQFSYPHILKMYICLAKKFGNFDQNLFKSDITHKILRKGIYTINMEGKKLTIDFLICISEVDRISYGNANCIRIFEPLMNLQTTKSQLNTLQRFLHVEEEYPKPIKQCQEQAQQEQERYPMRFKKIIDVSDNTILDILLKKLEQQSKSIIQRTKINQQQLVTDNIGKILKYFAKNQKSAMKIINQIAHFILRSTDDVMKYPISIQILNNMVNFKLAQKLLKMMSGQIYQYCISFTKWLNQLSAKQVDYNTVGSFITFLDACIRNNIINERSEKSLIQACTLKKQLTHNNAQIHTKLENLKIINRNVEDNLTQLQKQQMKKGVSVKMYKVDGSISSLQLFFTKDMVEVNCATSVDSEVKQKWRLAIYEATEIVNYEDNSTEKYQESIFEKSQGIFSKAPPKNNCIILKSATKQFFIALETQAMRKKWQRFFKLGRQNAKFLFNHTLK